MATTSTTPIPALPTPAMDASSSPITIIVSSIRGANIAFPISKSAPLTTLYDTLYERAPWIHNSTYILTTNARRTVQHSNAPVSDLLTSSTDTFLPLRLTVPLCGGKGGFGSILRAQGGRMSSRKKRDQGDANGLSRNLDGRRLRTVAEAKALAEYLAIKPDMERKEKAERIKRWEEIVETTERKKAEIKSGQTNAKLDGAWVDTKLDLESKTREEIERMLMAERGSEEEEDDEEEEEVGEAKAEGSKAVPQQFFGWDDGDEEFMSDSDEEDNVSEEDGKPVTFEGKGKGKAAA
ncbi:hypothetical protein P154DRAFT_527825 [Amniculicola lignicola CBS 123094]|uniref:Uncharacterized protein n=1 Tax=Amniculicola lignicola CBS 123094 TaxID=1392246 RepID=A0A6A5VVE0_9PLEO|nr:hypothetical protein P154DRAFT_527825 [Amniculicola lignicola CBS 123094]